MSPAQSSSPFSPPTTTTQRRVQAGYSSPGAGRSITAAWQPILPSGMLATPVRWSTASASSRWGSAGFGRWYTSPVDRDGAPPTMRIFRSSRAATAAVVRGVESSRGKRDQWPAEMSKSSTVGRSSARPKTSSHPPTAAMYLLLGATTRAPARATWRLAQGAHSPRAPCQTSQLLSVSMEASLTGAPGRKEQPPTTKTTSPTVAQPWPQRARRSVEWHSLQTSRAGS
mmetsp:Transcript_106537/g.306354  ORF Transcript_106537/g.306354 Transcript_106537/m.306354 type:complete len:227 (-) Transcript_106537:368-1048(-)